MPYICLARNDVPNGQVQITDLDPNSSLAIPSLSPPGETRYVRRVETGVAPITSDGYLDPPKLDGLAAYLLDKVEIGGIEQADATIVVLNTTTAGDTIVINGVTFTAVGGGAVAASRQFNDVASAGSVVLCAASLVTAITNATAITAVKAGTITGSYAHASAVSDTITLVARQGSGSTLTGPAGDMTLATNAPTHLTLSGDNLSRTYSAWTPSRLSSICDSIVGRMDDGDSLTISDINTILANVSADLAGTTNDSQSDGSVRDVLAILSGRVYRARREDLNGTKYLYQNGTSWVPPSTRAGFTQPVVTNGSHFISGEVKPSSIGGDIEQVEVGGIRHSYNIAAVYGSLTAGQLAGMTHPLSMWSNTNSPSNPSVLVDRLVTVYDDSGNVM